MPQCFSELVRSSGEMQTVCRLITRVAFRRHPVVIMGESGTGKELAARAIHAQGPWHDRPFVPVDCAALTPTLIESELFGHVRGAFTGATRSRQGLLAAADGGTLFLDEVAELPLELQSKLLRALQEREVRPLGSNDPVRLGARIISATNKDLDVAVNRGTFRKDLYFRLNVVRIVLPPLRERRSDIPALIRLFVDRYGAEGDQQVVGVSDEAMARLMSYDWPGNVRELENSIQHAVAVGSGPEIQAADLPPRLLYGAASPPRLDKLRTLQELERQTIANTLEAVAGDRIRAAKLLGIGKTTIYRKLKEYGLEHANSFPPSV